MIKYAPKEDVALERRCKAQIAEYKRKQVKVQRKIEKLKGQVVELSSEIGRALFWESRFIPDMLSTSIENTNQMLHNK